MSVPIYSDGVEEIAKMAITSQGWLQADEFISTFFSKISTQIAELSLLYGNSLKSPKKLLLDASGKPAYNELPQNYILANDPSSSTFAIVGHPSGLYFQSAEQFLPHLRWLCNPDRFRSHCSCSLCGAATSSPFNNDMIQSGTGIYSNLFNGQTQIQTHQSHIFGSQFVPQYFQHQSPSNFQIPIISSASTSQGQQSQVFSTPKQTKVGFHFQGLNSSEKSHLEIQSSLNNTPASVPIGPPFVAHQTSAGMNANEHATVGSGPKTSEEIIDEFAKKNAQIESMNLSGTVSSNLSAAETSLESSALQSKFRQDEPAQEKSLDKSVKKQRTRDTFPRRESLNITESKNRIANLDAENAVLQLEVSTLKADVQRYEQKNTRIRFEIDLLLPILFQSNLKKQKLEDTGYDGNAMMSDIESQSEIVEEDNDAPKIKKLKRKRPKLLDPNAPKRPANAFIMYAELQRAFVREEKRLIQILKPDTEALASLSNTTKALGLKWRNLDEKIRSLYQDMFRDLVKQYDHDIKEYMVIYPNAPRIGTTEPLPKDWTDPNAPKRPANAFFMFCEVEEDLLKNSNKDLANEEYLEKISLSLGERWLLLSDNERAVYESLYQARLETFRKYVQREKQAAGVVEEVSMQVDGLDQEDNDEDELVDSGDELVATNETSPL